MKKAARTLLTLLTAVLCIALATVTASAAGNSPATGDTTNLTPVIIVLCVSAAMVVVAIVLSIIKNKKK